MDKMLKAGSVAVAACAAAIMPAQAQKAARQTISLNGVWDVAESVSPTERPARFRHRGPVPALAHSSTPGFAKVDDFLTPEYDVVKRLVGLPVEKTAFKGQGNPGHPRNYLWYRTHFDAPAPSTTARLKVNKAQFGSEVWLNGVRVGGNNSGFTSMEYDITKAVRWSAQNEVLIRIGANPNVLPPGNTAIFDFEKTRWTPGIYDDVAVYFNSGVSITSTQVAPRLDPRQIVVQTQVKNTTSASVRFDLVQSVHAFKDSATVARTSEAITLAAGEERTVMETIPLPEAKLWSQEQPNLYVLETATGGDSNSTRFGMREFRFDTATKRAYLNGAPIFLRGGNIALHRFFDDENAGTLPWQDAWVRKLLGTIPRKMHWNTVKFTIGPVPERWLDIADEEGLLVLNEFPVWTLMPEFTGGYTKTLDPVALRGEYEAWLRDNWNHPSIVYWAASLESKLPEELAGKMIEAVRKLDLSQRPWGNSWNPPQGADDPHEYKQYISNDPTFDMTQLETGGGWRRAPYDPVNGHAALITEFDWIWLNRDGSPTPYTKAFWEKTPYPHATAAERFETQAYLLAGMIEYWRAHRHYAGVVYLAYLSQGWVVDNFLDVKELKFRAPFEELVGNAFKPLGVYLNYWQRTAEVGTSRTMEVMMVNDEGTSAKGTVALIVEDRSGKVLATISRPYDLVAHGQMTYPMTIQMPASEGPVTLRAVATPEGETSVEATISRRFVSLVPKGQAAIGQPRQVPTKTLESGGQFNVGKDRP